MSPEALAQVLQPLEGLFLKQQHPNLLLGLSSGDDAAVYRLNESTALILTVDFFTPVVDSPYEYGRIAAANALSDVYAMGGEAALALNICAFPASLPVSIHQEIIRGGADAVAEAGAVLAGGHTITDAEPKYGLAVAGFCHPENVLAKAGALPNDLLVLTKPLGTGIITTAAKRDLAAAGHIRKAIHSMMELNRGASRILRDFASSCTDVTGFSLIGHAWEIASRSSVTLEIDYASLPFIEGSEDYAAREVFPGGSFTNRSCYGPNTVYRKRIPEHMKTLLFTPETSGGLLASVRSSSIDALTRRFSSEGIDVFIIGRVASSGEKAIIIT